MFLNIPTLMSIKRNASAFSTATFLFIVGLSFGQAPNSTLPNGAAGGGSIMNQPVVVNTFENVEMERLRLADETAKLTDEERDFREQTAKLQLKLTETSIAGMTPASLPSDYRTFMSANAGDIQKSLAYYDLMKSVLNDLTPESPYRTRSSGDTSNPERASQKLLELSGYAEDDDLCRTIRGHLSSLTGGRVDDRERVRQIERELSTLEKERKRLEWNLKMSYNVNPLTGKESSTEDERNFIQEQLAEVKGRITALENEKKSLSHLVTAEVRKLQFQQLIVELAAQQRYIHALIASGFYRNSFKGGDLALNKEAYPTGSSGSQKGGGDAAKGSEGNSAAAPTIPYISTITGLEAFLLNRIRDAAKDRQAIDNMLRENQISAAESTLRKMVLTAKYQPELQTIPYSDRQRIQQFGQNIKKISDAVNSKDYPKIAELAEEIEKTSKDAGTSDLKAFAAEHPRKALHWAQQARLAMKVGDKKNSNVLMEAAIRRDPLNPKLERKIDDIQESVLVDTESLEALKIIVKAQDHKSAFDRMGEFAALLGKGSNSELKISYEALVEREKNLRASLEKCDAFERRSAYPEVWIALSDIDPASTADARVADRKAKVSGKCPRFISDYTSALELERKGKRGQALAMYLSALDASPSNETLVGKVTELGKQILK